MFEDYLVENYEDDEAERIMHQVDWEAWVMAPGLPPVQLDFMTPNITKAQELADDYI